MHPIRRAASVVAVSALLATGTVGAVAYNVSPAALPAAAAQVVAPALEGIPAKANLYVHKVIGLPVGTIPANGLQVDTNLGAPAVGVTYTAYRVNQVNGTPLSLATQEGWGEAAGVEIGSFFDTSGNSLQNLDTLISSADNPRLGTSTEATTNSDGFAAFTGLDTGLYLVVEENNPYSGGTPAQGGVAVAPSAPFLVTVPLTDPNAREGWLDTVHVYPKGQQFTSPQKRIVDPTTGEDVDLTGTSVGDRIAYDVSTVIPKISTGTLPGLSITDKLPAELGQGGVTQVRIGEQDLTEGTHYTIRSWPLESSDREVIIVRLEQPGLDILGDGNKTVSVRFTAVLNAVPRTGLTNTAWFRRVEPTVTAPQGWDPEAGDGTPGNPLPGTPTNLVTSTYGEIVINKISADGPRAGAQFELRRCYSEGQGNAGQVVTDSQPIRIGAQTSWITSNGSEEGSTLGSVTISGIHLSNTQPGDETTAVTTSIWADEEITEYCLVETKAPDDYELLPEPYLLGQFTGEEIEFKTVNVKIENVKANAGFNLPLTGGMGIWVALGGGALLLLIAAAYYAARNRKQA